MDVSAVVPAHDEDRLLGRGLDAIAVAAERARLDVEVVVVANRCTDRTAEIAAAAGAVVVESGARCLSAVRNAGIEAAVGRRIVTIDADSRMSPFALVDATRLLDAGGIVGGGTLVVPERRSAGITATYALVGALTAVTRLSGGMFWADRADIEAIGGFDEAVLVGEDLDFARRLRAHGRRDGRRFVALRTAPMVASCRKFDRHGDWHMFAMGRDLPRILRSIRGVDTEWVDEYFHDRVDDPPDQARR
ncbi:MAG: glycosyltransferase [Acidimicrobiales bacterium]|nr:glycosyltransferase [Acidimicrobiales bacterium]HRW36994.1 glycosyltransferase [Aquihabitans sp.]